jgi:dihydroxy-acid dehydratase
MTGKRSATTCRLLVNMQPAGEYLGEEYHRAGGVPAVVAELIAKGLIKPAGTVNGKSLIENCEGHFAEDRDVIKAYDEPMVAAAGFLNLKGNLFDSAIMKTSVISDEFRERYLSNPDDPNAFEGPRHRLRWT